MEKKIFKKGTYFIGDPCYLVKHNKIADKVWEDFIKLFYNEKREELEKKSNHIKGFYIKTARGDGEFRGKNIKKTEGFEVPVDSGILGITKINNLNPTIFNNPEIVASQFLGKLISFEEDFDVCEIENGVLKIDSWILNTY